MPKETLLTRLLTLLVLGFYLASDQPLYESSGWILVTWSTSLTCIKNESHVVQRNPVVFQDKTSFRIRLWFCLFTLWARTNRPEPVCGPVEGESQLGLHRVQILQKLNLPSSGQVEMKWARLTSDVWLSDFFWSDRLLRRSSLEALMEPMSLLECSLLRRLSACDYFYNYRSQIQNSWRKVEERFRQMRPIVLFLNDVFSFETNVWMFHRLRLISSSLHLQLEHEWSSSLFLFSTLEPCWCLTRFESHRGGSGLFGSKPASTFLRLSWCGDGLLGGRAVKRLKWRMWSHPEARQTAYT